MRPATGSRLPTGRLAGHAPVVAIDRHGERAPALPHTIWQWGSHAGRSRAQIIKELTGAVGSSTLTAGTKRLKFVACGQCHKLARFRTSICRCDSNRSSQLLVRWRALCPRSAPRAQACRGRRRCTNGSVAGLGSADAPLSRESRYHANPAAVLMRRYHANPTAVTPYSRPPSRRFFWVPPSMHSIHVTVVQKKHLSICTTVTWIECIHHDG